MLKCVLKGIFEEKAHDDVYICTNGNYWLDISYSMRHVSNLGGIMY